MTLFLMLETLIAIFPYFDCYTVNKFLIRQCQKMSHHCLKFNASYRILSINGIFVCVQIYNLSSYCREFFFTNCEN